MRGMENALITDRLQRICQLRAHSARYACFCGHPALPIGRPHKPPIQLPAYSSERLASLGLSELIELMIADEDRVPRDVIDECARRGDEMAQHLGGLLLDDEHWKEGLSDGEWWLRLHAVMILGRIASERAGLRLVELMRRMSMEDDKNLQGWCSGYWPALFANKPESVLPALRALSQDRTMDWYIRANAIGPVIAAADRQGEGALDAALEWLAGIAADEQEDWEVRLSAGNTLLDFPRARHRPLLDELAARQSVLGAHFCAKDVSKASSGVEQQKPWERFDDPWKFYTPESIAARQERWQEEEAQESERELGQLEDYAHEPYSPPVRCPRRAQSRPQRSLPVRQRQEIQEMLPQDRRGRGARRTDVAQAAPGARRTDAGVA